MGDANDVAARSSVHEEAPYAGVQVASLDGLTEETQELLDILDDDGFVERPARCDANECRDACFAEGDAAFDARIVLKIDTW